MKGAHSQCVGYVQGLFQDFTQEWANTWQQTLRGGKYESKGARIKEVNFLGGVKAPPAPEITLYVDGPTCV